jgi:hypothetical protein
MIEPPLPTARRHYSTNIGTTDKVDADLDQAEKRVANLEFRRMFNNPAAPNNCIIDIQAGAGGTFEATAREPGLQLNRHFGKWTFVQP